MSIIYTADSLSLRNDNAGDGSATALLPQTCALDKDGNIMKPLFQVRLMAMMSSGARIPVIEMVRAANVAEVREELGQQIQMPFEINSVSFFDPVSHRRVDCESPEYRDHEEKFLRNWRRFTEASYMSRKLVPEESFQKWSVVRKDGYDLWTKSYPVKDDAFGQPCRVNVEFDDGDVIPRAASVDITQRVRWVREADANQNVQAQVA